MSDIVILVHVDGLVLELVIPQIKLTEFIDMTKCLGWVSACVTIRIIYNYTLRMKLWSMIGKDIVTQWLYPLRGHRDIVIFK